ncbi:kinase-like domain-containing protein [Chytriomyces cf. hyalinus JEL632]|nr:kinase-like domain-containing protein [Chytriomyces cf. hyalinus JEL632]
MSTPLSPLIHPPASSRVDSGLGGSLTPPPLPPRKNRTRLYEGLPSETKARVAIVNAASLNQSIFPARYSLNSILGFGSNGVVLSALDVSNPSQFKPVALKIIYKEFIGHQATSSEIEILLRLQSRTLVPDSTTASVSLSHGSHLLEYVDHFQDVHHFYLVTNLVMSNWAVTLQDSQLTPLSFKTDSASYSLPFWNGSSDLYSWNLYHRAHLQATEGHKLLPLMVVKHIVRSIAHALSKLHNDGFYHGDLKFENVLVECNKEQYEAPAVFLADFGHAKHFTLGIKEYGTFEMSAPDVLSDSPIVSQERDGRTADIFALGILLYTLLSEDGQLPDAVKTRVPYQELLHASSFPLKRMEDMEEDAWDLMQKMVRVDPMQRATVDQILSHPWLV